MVAELAEKAKSIVRYLDPTNCLTFFRLKSATHEVLVALSFFSIINIRFETFFI